MWSYQKLISEQELQELHFLFLKNRKLNSSYVETRWFVSGLETQDNHQMYHSTNFWKQQEIEQTSLKSC